MDFGIESSKTLNDLMILRMLFLDHFYLFMGMNSAKLEDGNLADSTQYLFMMKDGKVKSEFKLHRGIAYMDKNVENKFHNKYLLTLGYDDRVDLATGNILETALVFKMWDFISLDSYVPATPESLTGGSIWDLARNQQMGQDTPNMFKIEMDGKPYLEPIKKFAVSRDCGLAALVCHDNQILIYRIIDQDSDGNPVVLT